MKRSPHHPTHWIAVALAASLALLALDAFGQRGVTRVEQDARAVYQGRPLMAGAQAGTGAMAGLPQGGLGVEGWDGAVLNLQPPPIIARDRAPLPLVCPDGALRSAGEQPLCLPQVGDERVERRLSLLGLDAQQRRRM